MFDLVSNLYMIGNKWNPEKIQTNLFTNMIDIPSYVSFILTIHRSCDCSSIIKVKKEQIGNRTDPSIYSPFMCVTHAQGPY